MKITLRFHLTPVREATIKNPTNKCWRGCRECKVAQPLRKTVWRLLIKLKIDLPYDPTIALLGI
jgi:hypothetical protein